MFSTSTITLIGNNLCKFTHRNSENNCKIGKIPHTSSSDRTGSQWWQSIWTETVENAYYTVTGRGRRRWLQQRRNERIGRFHWDDDALEMFLLARKIPLGWVWKIGESGD
ncbi:hypothetical protein DM860_013982 [Cuscuta australis]|uniref:Uncharacterized protein n=1 Tax=Cuscuta australis TaxID=267555 RepID=A0A328DQY7_9ASTE|nr:hypothetical protein DM860_013982 [Cuscuta australis]